MSSKALILHPRNPFSICEDMNDLIVKLQNAGFLGDKSSSSHYVSFSTGYKFLELISFMSSHSVGILENFADGPRVHETVDSKFHCYIEFQEVSPTPKVIISPLAATNPARCSYCGYIIEDWPDVISEWYAAPRKFTWRCPKCDLQFQIFDMDWRRAAGFARYGIKIYSIYPQEAYPSQSMMDLLEMATGEEWTYLYSWI